MEEFRKDREQYVLAMVVPQLEHEVNQCLITKKDYIRQILQNVELNNISISKLKEITKANEIQLLSEQNDISTTDVTSKNNIQAYYEIIENKNESKSVLAAVFIVPFKENTYKIIEKVDLDKLHPRGPFFLEVYKGDNLEEKSLITVVAQPFLRDNQMRLRNIGSDGHKPFRHFEDNPKEFKKRMPGLHKPFMRFGDQKMTFKNKISDLNEIHKNKKVFPEA